MHSSARFEELRSLILRAAADAPDIGEVLETLKWGQPSFASSKPNVGSSVRIEQRDDGHFALMFICTSGVVDEFRELYPSQLEFEGNRAINIPAGDLKNEAELKHCIQLALTSKLRKRKRSKT
ncbi:MAG: DUF1801 domain-containing protein [Pseudomonadota bacterium]